MPGQITLAAKLCDYVGYRREKVGFFREVGEYLMSQVPAGKALDIGTGAGYLLKAIHDLNPNIQLYGLDISEPVVKVCRRNMGRFGIPAEIHLGSIEKTDFPADFFDLVTCTSSFSYWVNPVACLDEVHRILAPGGQASLLEPVKGYDPEALKRSIQAKLEHESALRRFLAINLNLIGLKWGNRLGLKLSSVSELEALIAQTKFRQAFSVQPASVGGIPIFVRMTMRKAGGSEQ